MNPLDYKFLSEFLQSNSGLHLGENKEYLLESRLTPVAQSLGLSGIGELIQSLKRMPTLELKTTVVEAMTTNETLFFRDSKPFDDLAEQMIPEIMEANKAQRTIRIWCAASSTGQEPYSIAMQLRESFPELSSGWNVKIVATDIDGQILAKAQQGQYSQFEIQRGLSIQRLIKYFDKNEKGWQLKPEIRNEISWKQLNLLKDFGMMGQFDIIFCRNVLIYFTPEVKKQILDRMAKHISHNGYLILGGAETILGISDAYYRAEGCLSASFHPHSTKSSGVTALR
ncbi:MAG: protein-glutamate O-methyltransferase CheR [Planctomycetaceae bacterium]|nr:protein-glutamate O-methyltransferase CheR [Planctomycetaceae bacterium]